MHDLTTNQRISLLAACVFGAALIWTSAESIAMSFEFLGAYKVFPYLLATALLALAAFGMWLIKGAFTEEEYVRHKSLLLISGLVIYAFAFIVSVAGSIHNMYYRMTSSEMQEQEINEVYRDLSQANSSAASIVKRSVDDFNDLVEARLSAVIKEINNDDRPGAGAEFQKLKDSLASALGGITIPFVSAKVTNIRPTTFAINEFIDSVRRLKTQMISTKQASGKEITDQVQSVEFKALLAALAKYKNDYQTTDRDEVARVLKRAFGVRNDLSKRVERLMREVRKTDSVQAAGFRERPPSVDLQKVPYFWGEAWSGKDQKEGEGGVVSASKVRWATLFGVIFELAFAAFYYLGYLGRRQQ